MMRAPPSGGKFMKREFGVEEARIEFGVVNDQRRILDKVEKFGGDFLEDLVLREKFAREAMHPERLVRHVALVDRHSSGNTRPVGMRLEISTAPISTTRWPLDGIEPRRFSVENDLAHFSPEPRVKRFHDVSHLFARCVQTLVGVDHEIGAGALF